MILFVKYLTRCVLSCIIQKSNQGLAEQELNKHKIKKVNNLRVHSYHSPYILVSRGLPI